MSSSNNEADMQNPNKGSDGTNKAYGQNQGNRGKQLNPQDPKNNAQSQSQSQKK